MKRVLYVLMGLVGALIIVGVGYVLRTDSPVLPGGNGNDQPSGELPGTGTSSSTPHQNPPSNSNQNPTGALFQNTVADYYVSSEGIYILEPAGQVSILSQGKTLTISSTTIPQIEKSSFSFDGKKILALSGSGPYETRIFDLATRNWSLIGFSIETASWSPNSNDLIYLDASGGKKAIKSINLARTGIQPKTILQFQAENVDLEWVSKDEVMIIQKGSALSRGSVWALNLNTKVFSPLFQDVLGLRSKWFPGENRGFLLSGKENGRGGELKFIDRENLISQTFTFLTMPSKCIFEKELPASTSSESKDFIYCGVPKNQTPLNQNQMPDEYEKGVLRSSDSLYKIDLADGSIKNILPESSTYSVEKLRVFGKQIYFINYFDNKLYSVK